MSNRTEARSAKAARMHATGRLPLLRLFSTPLIDPACRRTFSLARIHRPEKFTIDLNLRLMDEMFLFQTTVLETDDKTVAIVRTESLCWLLYYNLAGSAK